MSEYLRRYKPDEELRVGDIIVTDVMSQTPFSTCIITKIEESTKHDTVFVHVERPYCCTTYGSGPAYVATERFAPEEKQVRAHWKVFVTGLSLGVDNRNHGGS